MYKKFVYKWVILQALLFILFLAAAAFIGLEALFAGTVIWFIVQTVLVQFFSFSLVKNTDRFIKENYPEIWERFGGKGSLFYKMHGYTLDKTIRSFSIIYNILFFYTRSDEKYIYDSNIINIKTDAVWALVYNVFFFLPFFIDLAALIIVFLL